MEVASDTAHRRCSPNLPLHWHLSWSMVSKGADKIAGMEAAAAERHLIEDRFYYLINSLLALKERRS